jgi:hypothetical protein
MPSRTFPSVTCTRCLGPRWPFHGAQPVDPYVCVRCTATLAGDPYTLDPLPNALLAARLQAGNRRHGAR